MSSPLQVVCPHCDTANRVDAARLEDGVTCGKCKEPLFPAKPIKLDRGNFDRQVASGLPIVVDFWASWCGPCRMMAPAFDEAAARVAPRVRLGKLDTEADPEIAGRYGIRAIPTLVAFRDGREVARQSGAMAAPQLVQWIQTHVAPNRP